ncbi:hypothetical protein PLESTB_000739500 [Pleodorina starrii]|uniref:Methyltransferase type 11 domain-containing protein n=1 Tax=Pleodorina starrii TaxID=330485 RepID=A0A9W6BKC6_9CHLO|nr:hypothetical protein PLESTM_000185000 [Pleodorina starrii]GLC53390.1 hypothetical protein PLESTB_000739500 [Pleodorina starrii]GLC67140.1 hypothetical protein PLESTF_000521600 [Pleodorina starrii]
MRMSAQAHFVAARHKALSRTRPILAPPHIRSPRRSRQCLKFSALQKDDRAASQPLTDERPGLPSVIRRTALLGATAPCLCSLCCGGGAAKAAAGGRNPLYDRYFATVMRYGMGDYEAIIRPVKSQLFGELVQGLLARSGAAEGGGGGGGTAAAAAIATAGGGGSSIGGASTRLAKRVLEVGVGTGPNFPFYTAALSQAAGRAPEPSGSASAAAAAEPSAQTASEAAAQAFPPHPPPLHIVGLDPNAEMLRFAGDAAKAAGLRLVGDGDGSSLGGDGGDGGSSSLSSTGGGMSEGSAASMAAVSLVQGSAEALPFSDGEFDAAVVTLVMCSVPSPTAALGELRRVVRPGGRLLIIEHVAAGEGRPGMRLAQSLLTPLQRLLADGCNLNRDTAAALRTAGWRAGQGELRSFELEGLAILAPHIAGVLVR